MGYIRNQCLVVNSWDLNHLEAAREKLILLCQEFRGDYPHQYDALVSEIVPCIANGGGTFLFGVDGSKEGWKPSKDTDLIRMRFIDWVRAQPLYLQWAQILLGGDDGEYAIQITPNDKIVKEIDF